MKAAILAITSCLFAGPGMAGMALICMDRHEMEAALIDWYGAAPVAIPQSVDPTLQIWVAADQGVWAMIRHDSSGRSCVLSTGERWLVQGAAAESMLQSLNQS